MSSFLGRYSWGFFQEVLIRSGYVFGGKVGCNLWQKTYFSSCFSRTHIVRNNGDKSWIILQVKRSMEILISNGESHSTSQHVGAGVGFHSTSEKEFVFLTVSCAMCSPSFSCSSSRVMIY